MESLESRWQQLLLSSEEDYDILVDEQALTKSLRKGENCLLGKLHMERPINQKIIRNTMAKAWKNLKPFEVKGLSSLLSVRLICKGL